MVQLLLPAFSTLELNVTFYRFPRLSVLQGWYDKSPADFRFAVKVYRGITHFKKFNDTTDLVTRFYEVVNDGLREKLGPVLFQMPPNFVYSDERLERVLNSLDPSFINVFEPTCRPAGRLGTRRRILYVKFPNFRRRT